MSNTIDERVVEMQFNNKDFETNVQTSLSTLDKLKEKLNLTGAAKGLENIDSTAKKIDMTGLGGAVETVTAKFSALSVIGVTALANITNSVVNTGKRIANALTIQPVMTGFSEYELKMNSVKTIMASTGESIETVGRYLDELNVYADNTIYSFSDMTANIGKFTNAGVSLDKAVAAIKGISNEAALAGANTNEASRAMYNFSQALSSGYVKLIDWKSIELANMATVEFKQELINTAVELGTLTKASDGFYKSEKHVMNATHEFNDSLQDAWMTSDVLVETLNRYTDTSTSIGERATKAATEVTTLTQLWGVMTESAQSGWARTWELIVGDLDQAKALFTELSNRFTGVIDKVNDSRNKLLEGALGNSSLSKWNEYMTQVNEAGITTEDFQEKLMDTARKHNIAIDDMIKEEGSFQRTLSKGWLTKGILTETLNGYVDGMKSTVKSTEDMTEKLKYFQNVVDKVWNGDYKNGAERVKALTAAGYDYAEVQRLVNLTIDHHRLKIEELSDAELKNVGYTEEEIEAIKKLAAETEKSGNGLEKIISGLSKSSGRELLIQSFRNILDAIQKPLVAIGDAWKNIFPPMTEEKLYSIIEAFEQFTESLIMSDETAENFQHVCEGLFSAFSLLTGVVSLGLRASLKLLNEVLKLFGTDLMGLAGYIGQLITRAVTWIKENTIFVDYISKLSRIIYTFADGIIRAVKELLKLEQVRQFLRAVYSDIKSVFSVLTGGISTLQLDNFITSLKAAMDDLVNFIKSLKDSKDILGDITTYFTGKLTSGLNKIGEIFDGLLDTAGSWASEVQRVSFLMADKLIALDIWSHITSFFRGTTHSITDLFKWVWDRIKAIGEVAFDFIHTYAAQVYDFITKVNWGAIGVIATAVLFYRTMNKLIPVLEMLATPIKMVGNLMSGIANILTSVAGAIRSIAGAIDRVAKAKATEIYTQSIKNVALAILMLAGAVTMIALAYDTGNMWKAVGVIAVLTVILAALMGLSVMLSSKGQGLEGSLSNVSIGGLLFAFATSLIEMAIALKIIASIQTGDLKRSMAVVAGLFGIFILIAVSFALISKFGKGLALGEVSGLFGTLAATLISMAVALKIVSKIEPEKVDMALMVIGRLVALLLLFTVVSALAGPTNKAGATLLAFSFAILILAAAMKLIGTIKISDAFKALMVIGSLVALLLLFTVVSALAGPTNKAGATLLAFSFAILILAAAMKLIGVLKISDIVKGLAIITYIGALFIAFIGISYFSGEHALKAAGMILGIATAIGIIAVAFMLLGAISIQTILKGMVVIAMLGVFFYEMVKISQFAGQNAIKAGVMLIAMSIAILNLVVVIALLSFLKPEDVIRGTLVISALLFMFALVLAASAFAKDAKQSIITIGVCLAILAGVLIALTHLDTTKLLTSTAALVLVMAAFAGMMIAVRYIGTLGRSSIKSLGIMLGVVLALGVIIVLLSKIPGNALVEKILGISALLLSLAISLAVIGKIPKGSLLESLGVMSILTVVIIELGLILAFLSSLNISVSLKTVASLSILLLAMAGVTAILSVVGAAAVPVIIGAGVFAAVVAIIGVLLAGLGALVKYVPEVQEFVNKGIPLLQSVGEGIGSFIGGIGSGVAKAMSSTLPQLGTDLADFMTNLQPFLDGVSSIKPGLAKSILQLSEAFALLSGGNFLNALTDFIPGDNSLATFSEQLVTFGRHMKFYAKAVNGLDTKSIIASAKAAKAMGEVANAIPNTGGFVTVFTGDNDLATFGQKMVDFGGALQDYADAVTGLNTGAITTSTKAAESILDIANAIPNSGGIEAILDGDNDMAAFGQKMQSFGDALKAYSESVTDLNIDGISNSKEAAGYITDIASKITEGSQGMWDLFKDDKKFSNLSKHLPDLGDAISSFSDSVSNVKGNNLTKVADGIASLIETIKKMDGMTSSGVNTFVSNVNSLAGANYDGLSKVKIDTSGFNSVGGNITKSVSSGIDSKTINSSLSKALGKVSSKVTVTGMDKIGNKMVTQLTSGIKSDDIRSKLNVSITSAKSGVNTNALYTVGQNLAQGLINGLESKKKSFNSLTKWFANRMASVLSKVNAMRSPSRRMMKLGAYLGEGLIIGLRSEIEPMKKVSNTLANVAAESLSSALNSIPEILSGVEDPDFVIKPIVDLSNVEKSANDINSLFGSNTVGAMANVNAAAAMMNGRIQNGFNSDVLSAIRDLKDSMQNMGNVTNINGITYDDGSNITDAVKSIVRAARIERRV